MDRIWQWTWDRYGARYLWALCVAAIPVMLAVYLPLSFLVVTFEDSGRYLEAAVVTVAAIPVLGCIVILPGHHRIRLVQRWAAGDEVDRLTALEGTYHYLRTAGFRAEWATCVWAAVLAAAIGAIAGATEWRIVQYRDPRRRLRSGGAAGRLSQHHGFGGGGRPSSPSAVTPGIGDSLPRSRPTFAGRSNLSMVAVALVFAGHGCVIREP